MAKISIIMSNFVLKIILVIFTFCSLCACTNLSESHALGSFKQKSAYSGKHNQLWGRMRDNFQISKKTGSDKHQRVQQYVKKLAQAKSLKKMSTQATPYLYYIVEQLEKRNMPTELALLPMVESEFKVNATSHQGATGLWQFIAGTGRMYGLKQDAWYDGRKDVKASTNAALDYLKFLHKEFDNNWMLALAAYNAGPGNVHRAIKRNKRAGKSTSFWELKLPKETMAYVPKFLALAEVVSNPEKHGVSLAPIENKPYFLPVNPGKAINFNQAAKLADLNLTQLKLLNPGYRQSSTHPKGPQELLLPVANAQKFQYNLAKLR